MDKYSAYQKHTLATNGFKVDNLTQSQIDTIMIPFEAPENYMCDGEINAKQAKARWKQQLIQSGINGSDLLRALKLIK